MREQHSFLMIYYDCHYVSRYPPGWMIASNQIQFPPIILILLKSFSEGPPLSTSPSLKCLELDLGMRFFMEGMDLTAFLLLLCFRAVGGISKRGTGLQFCLVAKCTSSRDSLNSGSKGGGESWSTVLHGELPVSTLRDSRKPSSSEARSLSESRFGWRLFLFNGPSHRCTTSSLLMRMSILISGWLNGVVWSSATGDLALPWTFFQAIVGKHGESISVPTL